MSKAKRKPKTKLLPFDPARYLTDDKAVAEYMTAILEANDPDLLLAALGDVARARGMSEVAKNAGLGRESLYKALAPGAKPRIDTVLKVTRALGVKLSAHVA
jgi:probable addiction module antidote protein